MISACLAIMLTTSCQMFRQPVSHSCIETRLPFYSVTSFLEQVKPQVGSYLEYEPSLILDIRQDFPIPLYWATNKTLKVDTWPEFTFLIFSMSFARTLASSLMITFSLSIWSMLGLFLGSLVNKLSIRCLIVYPWVVTGLCCLFKIASLVFSESSIWKGNLKVHK